MIKMLLSTVNMGKIRKKKMVGIILRWKKWRKYKIKETRKKRQNRNKKYSSLPQDQKNK